MIKIKDIILEKIKDINAFKNDGIVEVALSVEKYKDSFYGVSRRLDLLDESSECSGWRSDLVFCELDDNFNLKKTEIFTKGEDPRLFVHNEELKCITWVWNPERHDLDMYLINFNQNTKIKLNNLDINFNGKNWVPFVYNNELYFIYSLEPLIILKFDGVANVSVFYSDIDKNKLNTLRWNVGIGNMRAGSKGIQFGNNVILFSRTASPGPHIIHVTSINMENYSVTHECLEKTRTSGVHDPYGFFEHDGTYYISTTESDDLWGPQNKHFRNSLYIVKNL